MKFYLQTILVSFIFYCQVAAAGGTLKPNLLLIVADDLGSYSDLSAFGGEIQTPNLDGLVRDGLVFTGFYVAPTCSPTRAMLFSGTDSHLAGLGTMDELRYASPLAAGTPGYEGYLNFDVVTVADVLRGAGYRTYLSGKWHLGYSDDNNPATRGFDRSFALLDGAASHFDQTGIRSDVPRARYREDGRTVDLPDGFTYSSDFFTDKLIAYLREHDTKNRPFFAVLAFTAPHWPLQAPQEDVDKYKGVYDQGWTAIRAQRVAGLRRLGMIDDDHLVDPGDEVGWRSWGDLDDETRAREARLMQVYAAMVTRLDWNVGRVLDYLRAHNLDRNTYVFFMSDNGPEGNDPRGVRGVGGWVDSERFDNRYENMGKPGSFLWLSPEWAHVSSTPYRLFKGFTSEGGIRVPLLVRRPTVPVNDQIHTVGQVFNVTDLTATLAALGRVDHWPAEHNGRPVASLAGTPIGPIVGRVGHDDADKVVARELFGRKSLRRGDWKILWIEPPKGSGRWELYNLRTDPAESNDRAAAEPQRLNELVALWQRYAAENNVRAGGAGGYGK